MLTTEAPSGTLIAWKSDGPRVIDPTVRRLWFTNETVGRAIGSPDQTLETEDGGASFSIHKGTVPSPEVWLGAREPVRPAPVDASLLERLRAPWEGRRVQTIVSGTATTNVDSETKEKPTSNNELQEWLRYIYAANMDPKLRSWHCSVSAALHYDFDAARCGAAAAWCSAWGGTYVVEASGQGLHWRGRDRQGGFDVRARPQSGEAYAWLRQLCQPTSTLDPSSVEVRHVSRHFVILSQNWAEGADLRILRANGTWESLAESACFNPLITEPLHDSSLLVALVGRSRWDLIHIGAGASVLASRWILVGANEAMRLSDEDSGPGFVLIHDGVFRKYSLVPGTAGTVVQRPSAPITLCGERHRRGGFVLFEPTLAQLEIDNRLNWAFYGAVEYPPSDTVAVVQIDDAGACLRGMRTHVGTSAVS